MKKDLALADIRIDGGTQQRKSDDAYVLRYQTLIAENPEAFPPVDILFDGKDYWLWDGFHRYHAYRKLGKNYIPASIEDGTKREAIFASFSANKDHGFPRQPGTVKAMLIEKIFPDEEWGGPEWTDEAIAQWIGGVTRQYISHCRKNYEADKKKADTGQGSSEPEKTDDNEPESPAEEIDQIDSPGRKVPEHLREIFSRVAEVKEHIKTINKMFKTIKDAQANNDPIYANCKLDQLKAAIGNVRSNLRFTFPYAVCGYCGGDVNNKDCRACNGNGFVNEATWLATPKDMRGK